MQFSPRITTDTIIFAKIELFKRGKFDWLIHQEFKTAHDAMDILLNNDNINELLFGGAAGGGKSFTGWAWGIFLSLSYPGINGAIARDELIDLTSSGMITFREVARLHGLLEFKHWRYDGAKHCILLHPAGKLNFQDASVIWLIGVHAKTSDTEIQSLGSTLYAWAFIEEAGDGIKFAVYDTLVHARVGRCPRGIEYGLKPKSFMTCNPSDNWTNSEFYTPFKKGCLIPGRAFINSFVDDNPYQTDDYKKNLDRLSPDRKARLKFGSWEFATDDRMLCDVEAIADLFYNMHVSGGQKRLSADIAMQGNDLLTILYADGLRCEIDTTMQKAGGESALAAIKSAATRRCVGRSNIVFDGDGVGAYLDDFLKVSKIFHNSGAPISSESAKEYLNLKAECGWMLARKVNAREIYIKTEDADIQERIIREFKCLRYEKVEGKLRLIKKDEMKTFNDGKSTDYLDLFIMLMIFEIKPKVNINTFAIPV